MNHILVEKLGSITIFKINRPSSYNALNRELVDELDTKLDEIGNDKSTKVLIVMGNGSHFAAGADISNMAKGTPEFATKFSFKDTFNKLENLNMPTVAAISGYALGGGLELTLACDIRIASANVKLGLPEINLGIMPGAGGTQRLPRLIGEARAKEIIYLGDSITAKQAFDYGLIYKIVEEDQLENEAMCLAEKLSKKAPIALITAKKAIQEGANMEKKVAIDYEARLWASLFATEDQKEGISAFLEKRKPSFIGK